MPVSHAKYRLPVIGGGGQLGLPAVSAIGLAKQLLRRAQWLEKALFYQRNDCCC